MTKQREMLKVKCCDKNVCSAPIGSLVKCPKCGEWQQVYKYEGEVTKNGKKS
jgi:hypothetical protein